ncbi:hypothetical protein [Massilia aquatica]|uniref:Uncharacterized protein n=1 Tax=Massilia aquatica TaxID=2609000 RepID=A0ABX0MJ75_9BURK|nr:hypothetical protein [Massilia aquatica]NHZ43876.1 hypothetical protein [Massilia aquatica]
MNNDDMSDDEFDAFLRGEDDLSRRLQGLTQPASSPKLDAAILGYVKAGLEQEARAARPAAANDAVIDGAPPLLAPGVGRRWRIPAGIAAGVLAGVLGHQAYQGSGARMEDRMAAAEPAQAPVVLNMPAEMARAAPPMMPPAAPVPRASSPMPAPSAVVASAAPEPAVRAAPPVQVAAAPEFEQLQRVEITGSSIKRRTAETSSPVQVFKEKAATPSYEGYNSDNPVPEMQTPARAAAAPAPVAAPPAPALAAPPPVRDAYAFDLQQAAPQSYARAAKPAQVRREPEEVAMKVAESSKIATADSHDKHARDWLAVIDAMLKAKLDRDALAEWTRFRAAYPDYPVPAATRDRIAAIKP